MVTNPFVASHQGPDSEAQAGGTQIGGRCESNVSLALDNGGERVEARCGFDPSGQVLELNFEIFPSAPIGGPRSCGSCDGFHADQIRHENIFICIVFRGTPMQSL